MTKFHGCDETICSWLGPTQITVSDLSERLHKSRIYSYQTFLNSLLDLLNLNLTEPLDLEQSPASRTMHRLREEIKSV